jgi:Ni/Co efflux regulator RcnB
MTTRALLCLIAAFALVSASITTPVQAASASTAKSAKKQKSHSAKFIKNPNQETSAERERRFKRECKGLPNAGACLGYAS